MESLNRDIILTHVQEMFRDNLVAFLGSGASAPYGLPTMNELSNDLLARLSDSGDPLAQYDESDEFSRLLRTSRKLEADLSSVKEADFLDALREAIASCVEKKESSALPDLLTNEMHLEMLITRALRVSSHFTVVTTNYDRLVEFSAQKAGFPVDTSFLGAYLGKHDPESCRSMYTVRRQRGRKPPVYHERKHVRIFKPHGSLGWFDVHGEVRESTFALPLPRKVIAPTEGKFQEGYEEIYSFHRTKANEEIKKASALLVVGYGFWDGHLHQQLVTAIQSGTPTVILTRSISDHVLDIVRDSASCLLLGKGEGTTTRCVFSDQEEIPMSGNLWDLQQLFFSAFPIDAVKAQKEGIV